jgi:Uncharacterized KleE stable inheritance protein
MTEFAMGVIVQFPKVLNAAAKRGGGATSSRQLVVRTVWVLVAMVWPILRWILALDVTLQLFRVLIISASRGWYMDWYLMGHFAVFVIITYFVTVYQPT